MSRDNAQTVMLSVLVLVLAGMLMMWPLGRIWSFSQMPGWVSGSALLLAMPLLAYGWYLSDRICRTFRQQRMAMQGELEHCRESVRILAVRQAFYQTILDDLPEMVCRWQPDGRISYVNEAYCRYFDISAEDVMRQGAMAHFRPSTGGDVQDLAFYCEQPVVVVEFPVHQADGSVRWQRWIDRALFDASGTLCEFQSIGDDITARKLAEQESAQLLEDKKRLVRMALAIQEQERAYLARELHDELGQSLTAIRAEAQCVLHLNRGRSAMISECAGSIDQVARQVYKVVNGMMHRLRPVLLDDLGLIEALHELIKGWAGHHPELTLQVFLAALPPLDSELELTVFRVIQEALTNIANHAHASQLEVSLLQQEEKLVLTIRDNGVGFANSSQEHGYGLLGMRERCLAVAGEFTLNSQAGTGTTLRVVLPLNREQNDGNRDD